MKFAFAVSAVLGIGMLPLAAQEFKPAPVLEIIREGVKEGRAAAHEKVETEYAAAFRKANYPGHYVAMAATSGPSEAWFIVPMASFAASEEYDKAAEKEPLKSALAMMDSRDGELRSGSRTMWAVYRPDLSYGVERFNPGKTRYVTVGSMRVRLGRDEDFAEGAKMYFAAWKKANLDETTLGYQVVAGAPAGTYLFFTMNQSMAALDKEPEHMQAVQEAMGKEEFAKFMKGSGEMFLSMEDTILQVKPAMSYPPQALIDADPAFWKPRPVAKAVTGEATREAKKQ